MRQQDIWLGGIGLGMSTLTMMQPSFAEQSLSVVYPPADHQTVADRIFFIGTASPNAEVQINGQVIENRSPNGHFAPTLPLILGNNTFTLTHQGESLTLTVTRLPATPSPPEGVAFAEQTLLPNSSLTRRPGELICFSAVAPPQAEVSVLLADQRIPLRPRSLGVALPANSAVLTNQTAPIETAAPEYAGCATFNQPGHFGIPEFQLTLKGQTLAQAGAGPIEILSPTDFQVAEVIVPSGTARTGPSTDYSRLTPLPQGTQALITGREGDWLRLDYGAWIRANETRVFNSPVPPRTIIRGIRSQPVPGWTEIVFPLQVPVPVSIAQDTTSLTLTLYNTTPQTDTIYFSEDPVVERMDWQPILPDKVEYTFHFKTDQQWGYTLRYEGTNLILSLRHPPNLNNAQLRSAEPLLGTTIVLDPGHGGEETGSVGPTGYPEKAVNLVVSNLLKQALEQKGARVLMTRTDDRDVTLRDRMDFIANAEPTLALSIHYNALPDSGDALNTAGIGAFWYHPQAHDLALFLHNYLVENLDRPDYGVYWNNLALTRPNVAPTVLLELGFMINPTEFEWVVDPTAQQQLVSTLADGIEVWIAHQL
jgi:N-acetylmuramoyl-L-alanine amidase